MNSLELRSKSKEEMLEWRAAIELAMTPSATSIQAQIDETKDTYKHMADVIQRNIDELSESQSSTALQVRCVQTPFFVGAIRSLAFVICPKCALFIPAQISVKKLQDLAYLFKKKFDKNENFFVQVTCGAESHRTNCFKVRPLIAAVDAIVIVTPVTCDQLIPEASNGEIDFGDDGAISRCIVFITPSRCCSHFYFSCHPSRCKH